MTTLSKSVTVLSDEAFEQISRFVRSACGINLHDGKRELVKARLAKRMRALGITSYTAYMRHVESDSSGAELTAMLDVISTNLTYFFREAKHFAYLRETLVPRVKARPTKRIRIWSAGCSSGEEPYSIAMLLSECLPDLGCWDAAILATDLSTAVLAAAREGVYRDDRFRQTPRELVGKYFDRIQIKPQKLYRVRPSLRRLVHIAKLNLMEPWPMTGPFDAIFCRNVMIYFDKPTQGELVRRFSELLAPGGALLLGHSESLTGVKHKLRYVQPAVYERP